MKLIHGAVLCFVSTMIMSMSTNVSGRGTFNTSPSKGSNSKSSTVTHSQKTNGVEEYWEQHYDMATRHVIYTNEDFSLAGYYDYHVMSNKNVCPRLIKQSDTPWQTCRDYMNQQIASNNINCDINYIVGRTYRLKCSQNSGVEKLGIENLAISGVAKITDTDGIDWTPGKTASSGCKDCGKKKSNPKKQNSSNKVPGYCSTKMSKSGFDPLLPVLHNPVQKPNCSSGDPVWPPTDPNICNNFNNCESALADCPQNPFNKDSCQWEGQFVRTTSSAFHTQNRCAAPCAIGNRGNTVQMFIIDTGCDVDVQALAPNNFTCANINNTETVTPSRFRFSMKAGDDTFFTESLAQVLAKPNIYDTNLRVPDLHGHGTFVATHAAGQGESAASEADVVCLKAFGLAGEGSTRNVKPPVNKAFTAALIQALDTVISLTAKVDASNTNIDIRPVLLLPWNAPKNYLIDKLVREAQNKDGITVVMAAGNQKKEASLFSPASSKCGTVVGAVSQCGKLLNKPQGTSFKGSNFGHAVDFNLPGFLVGAQTVNRDFNGNIIPTEDLYLMMQAELDAVDLTSTCDATKKKQYYGIIAKYNKLFNQSLELRSGTGYAAAQLAGIFAAYTSKCVFTDRQTAASSAIVVPGLNCQCDPKQSITEELQFIVNANNVKTKSTTGASCYTSAKSAVDVLVGKGTQNEICLGSPVGSANAGVNSDFDLFIIALALGSGGAAGGAGI